MVTVRLTNGEESLPSHLDPAHAVENDINHSHRGHAVLGGSSAARWSTCTGSVFLKQQAPPKEETEDMRRGTEVHEVCEAITESFLKHKADGSDHEVTRALYAEDLEALELADGYAEFIYDVVLEGSLSGKVYGIEDFFALDESLEMYGYPDFWSVMISENGKRVLKVVDYKNGTWKVAATKNPQGAFYACCIRQFLNNAGKDIDYCYVYIYQPNALEQNEDGTCYSVHKFTQKQLETWKKKFYKAAHQIFVKKKPRYKTGEHCRFCEGRAICEKYTKEAGFEESLVLAEPDPKKLPEVSKLSDEQVLRVIQSEEIIKQLINACKEYARGIINTKGAFPGLKLVEGRSQRTLIKNPEVVEATLAQHGLSADDIYDKKAKSLAALKKEIWKRNKPVNNMTQKEADAIVSQVCEMTTPSISLVPESDPREAVNPVASSLNAIDYNE